MPGSTRRASAMAAWLAVTVASSSGPDRVGLAVDVVQVEGLAGELDVALDVGLLPAGLGRLDLEALHERRVHGAGHDGDEHPQPDGDDRQPPAPLPDVDDEQGGGQQRDDGQQLERGQLRVDVGVGGALDRAAGGGRQLVALQPVADRLEQGEDGQQHRDVELDLGADPAVLHLEPDATVEVVGDRGDDEDDHERREEPVDHERQERQAEHVEADVLAELGILDAEA